jgi:myo-inositol-1(or 4)-monophosphatase
VIDLDAMADAARAAALAGGAVVTARYGAARDVREKAPGDWVSEADLSSEQAVRGALAVSAPGIPVFGEEAGGERGAIGWLVDPLDGTANFLHGFPIVGVSVALVEDGMPLVGVVHAPMLGDTYLAVRGRGAYRGEARLSVSTRPAPNAIAATGFPFRRKDRREQYLRVFDAAFERFEDLRRAGAASLDLAFTACGTFDGYFELSLGPWDVAAGALLVTEAGGVVTDWAGDDRRWLETGDIIAAPPEMHEQLLDLARASTSA